MNKSRESNTVSYEFGAGEGAVMAGRVVISLSTAVTRVAIEKSARRTVAAANYLQQELGLSIPEVVRGAALKSKDAVLRGASEAGAVRTGFIAGIRQGLLHNP